jgi:hypothetical protein
MNGRIICGVAISVLVVGACGSDNGSEDIAGEVSVVADDVAEDLEEPASDVEEAADDLVAEADAVGDDVLADAEQAANDIADDLEATQDAVGGGGATFTANGQTWEFPSVLCAFGEDQIGQAGGVFNLSAIDDGVQLYASIDDSGASHSLSLNDIKDFENPSVSLSVDPFTAGMLGASTEFLVLDGKQVTADVAMLDDTTNEPIAGTAQLSATCP